VTLIEQNTERQIELVDLSKKPVFRICLPAEPLDRSCAAENEKCARWKGRLDVGDGSNFRPQAALKLGPFIPQQQTYGDCGGMSEKCQKDSCTSAIPSNRSAERRGTFDDFVGPL
jgi:hypothetical protein